MSKTPKKQKNLYLTEEALQLLAAISRKTGVNDSAVVELMVRERAEKEGIKATELN